MDKKTIIVSKAMGDRDLATFWIAILRPLLGTLAGAFIQAFFLCFTDFGIPASVGMAFFAQPICQLLLYNQPEVAQEAAPLLTMLSLAIAFSGLLFTTNSILQSFGRTTQPVIDMAVGGVVKVALSYVLIGIPQVAAMGSAISTVASYVVMVVLNLIAIRSSLPRMDSVVRTALPLLLSAGVMGGVSYGFYWLLAQFISPRLAVIPAILLAVGMWMFYVTCRNTQSGNISTAGLTICKVIAYITLVFICALAALLLVMAVLLMIGGVATTSAYNSYYYDDGSAAVLITVLGVLLVVLAAVMALLIAYYVCVIKTINRIKASALNGAPDNRIPRFLTVLMMVTGVLSGLGGLFSLFTTPAAGIASLAGAVCAILMSLLLSEYRAKMSMLLYPPVQPMYNNMPPYGNVPPQQPGGPNGSNLS